MQNGSKSVVAVQVKELLSQMTLEEKASLCSGQDFWHMKSIKRLDIPSLMMTDGPYGLRKQTGAGAHIGQGESVPATCFPSLVTLGSTWNRDLAHAVGHAIGEEARAEKVAVVLGPGANIKRSPLCGRNFEYFSEDPFLAGEMAKSHIQGLQSTGVGASLKHYVANNQEYRRMMINAVIDERALREIYLAGFEIAVKKAQPATVMCAYNQVNGVSCSEHYRLMTQILKEEWGHTGLVVTDWGAINRRVDGLLAGIELQMPGTGESSDRAIVAAVKAGELSESVLDYAVERLLTLILERTAAVAEDSVYDAAAHHALGHKVATEGAVLLKNTPAILPLTDKVSVAVIGELAKAPRFQGGGSANVNPIQIDNAWDEMVKLMGPEHLSYAAGYDVKTDQVDPQLIAGACEVARTADVVVVFAGLTDIYECEGADRDHMQLPANHNVLIEAVAEVNPNTVVVLSNGSPVEMPWVDQVAAILEGYLGGQAGGSAIADILYGRANPSGKLAETFP
ncbi:MAG: glycoside hydrolase family 3 protein, partial [Anaerolineae bacterium]|nr:glycoside hydrolase family 3 protein [Anaerolineae bacterium]